MSIHTVEQLNEVLSRELVWRKKELTALYKLASRANLYKNEQEVLIRSSITMLYAHWEGFVKKAATNYLEFVARRRLTYQNLTANFIALAMKTKLKAAQETDKATILNGVVEFFLTGLSERAQLPYEDVIKTQSNLSSEVMKEIISTLNLDYTPYSDKREILDEQLLRSRNNIAHGEWLLMDLDGYSELKDHIFILMDTFKNQIENAACTEAYRR
jgi:hypothetical protein